MCLGLGWPQPISILETNPTLKEWLANQGKSIENVSYVETVDNAEGLHIWVNFSNEPDVVAYRCFPELNHDILPPINSVIYDQYKHYKQIRM